MITGFSVKVRRYCCHCEMEIWDGWYISKVYAIKGNEFLVFDNGMNSERPGDCSGFEWVDYTEVLPTEDGFILQVELWEDESKKAGGVIYGFDVENPSELSSVIWEMQGRIADLENNTDYLPTEIEMINDDLERLETAINKLKGEHKRD